ncbi:hypothetical protein J6590_091016, partial [Homalodisca vitripennis]
MFFFSRELCSCRSCCRATPRVPCPRIRVSEFDFNIECFQRSFRDFYSTILHFFRLHLHCLAKMSTPVLVRRHQREG